MTENIYGYEEDRNELANAISKLITAFELKTQILIHELKISRPGHIPALAAGIDLTIKLVPYQWGEEE